ncbi:MAG: hypothetical protein LQ341_007688, partial [Variospora aurantia]
MAAAKRLLEVESKFLFNPSLVPTLLANRGTPPFKRLESLGTHKFTDTYFDSQDTLSKNGIWLRQRTAPNINNNSSAAAASILEAKVRISGDFARSTFDEITDPHTIAGLIRPHLPHFSAEKQHRGLEVLAEFTTTRQGFRADGKFAVVLDRTDFGHSVGEVELMAEDEAVAHREIEEFMEGYRWFFGKGEGKGKTEG